MLKVKNYMRIQYVKTGRHQDTFLEHLEPAARENTLVNAKGNQNKDHIFRAEQ